MRHAPSVVRSSPRAASIAASLVSTAVVLALTVVGSPSSPASAPSAGDRQTDQRSAKVRTHFAFHAAAYGSRVKGGEVPARSDPTAFQSLGCTNMAGVNRTNHAETSQIDGVASARNIRTRTWTTRADGVTASNASNRIERLLVSGDDFGRLAITRLHSLARAFHDGSGFHSSTKTTVGDITYTDSDGASQDLDPPTASEPTEIPGVLRLTVGDSRTRAGDTSANAVADGMNVLILPSNTRLRLAHTAAKLTTGVTRGLFRGKAAATQTRSHDPLLRSGPQPLMKMPCLGTGGAVREKSTTRTGPEDLFDVSKVHTRQRGAQTKGSASGFEEASVSSVDVGSGQLRLTGIVGRVNVTRTRTGLARDTGGTTIGSATVGGETFALPDLDGFTIPGLVRVDTHIVTTVKDGLDVVAVRLTFLDGSGRVTDLGHARLAISRAG